MKVFRVLLGVVIFCYFSQYAKAEELKGPSVDSDGSFKMSWARSPANMGCGNAKITASGNSGYEDIFSVAAGQTSFQFYGLPDGNYTISLSASCGASGAASTATLIAARSVVVKSDASAPTKTLAPSADPLQTNTSSTVVSASAGNAGTFCGTSCAYGTHVEQEYCSAHVTTANGGFHACPNYSGLSGCVENRGTHNSVFCQTNTASFWTCGSYCPSGYDSSNQIYNSARCNKGSGGREIYCVLNTSPPATPTLSGQTSRLDGKIDVSVSFVKHTNKYEWKFSFQSGWTTVKDRAVIVSGLTSGVYTVQVRACNSYGCSSTASRSITLSVPSAPSITSSASTSEDIYNLTWGSSNGAQRYEWKNGNGSWVGTTATSYAIASLVLGTHTFYVRACNAVECGAAASKSVTISHPPAPVINSTSAAHQSYYFAWSASVGATRYEWRNNSGSWNSVAGTSVQVALAGGSNTLNVRACNSRGCGTASSIVVANKTIKVFEYNAQSGNTPSTCSLVQIRYIPWTYGRFTHYRLTCSADVLEVEIAQQDYPPPAMCSVSGLTANYIVTGSCSNWRVYK